MKPPRAPVSPRGRSYRTLVMLVVGALSIPFVCFGAQYLGSVKDKRRLADTIALVRRQSVPVTMDELRASTPPVDPDEHAAEMYFRADSQMSWYSTYPILTTPFEIISLPPIEPYESLPEAYSRNVEGSLDGARDAIELCARAAGKPCCYWRAGPGDSLVKAKLPPHPWSLAQALLLSSWYEAEKGDGAAAMARWRDAWAFARSFDNDPYSLASSKGLTVRTLCVQALERLLVRANLTERQLDEIEELLTAPGAEFVIEEHSLGEVVFEMQVHEGLRSGDLAVRKMVFEYRSGVLEEFATRLSSGSPVELERKCVRGAACVAAMSSRGAPLFEVHRALEHFYRPPDWWTYYKDWAFREQCDLADSAYQYNTLLRAALAAIAAERFRRDNDRLPYSLNELVGAYLDSVPQDPVCAGDAPLLFKAVPEGIIIYGVRYVDCKDDGADPEKDAVFRLLSGKE